MKKTRLTTTGLRGNYGFAVLVLSMFIFLSGTFLMTGMAFADDADTSIDSATFIGSTLILDLPELAVEGTDLLYSAQLQLKQEGENIFLELINLGPSQSQEATPIAATLSADGTFHIPVMYAENNTLWTIDLKLVNSVSLLPIKFNITNIVQVPKLDQNDDLLGQAKTTTITISTPWGPIVIVIKQDDGKAKPFTY